MRDSRERRAVRDEGGEEGKDVRRKQREGTQKKKKQGFGINGELNKRQRKDRRRRFRQVKREREREEARRHE